MKKVQVMTTVTNILVHKRFNSDGTSKHSLIYKVQVRDIETGEVSVHNTATEAAERYNISPNTVSGRLRKKYVKPCKGRYIITRYEVLETTIGDHTMVEVATPQPIDHVEKFYPTKPTSTPAMSNAKVIVTKTVRDVNDAPSKHLIAFTESLYNMTKNRISKATNIFYMLWTYLVLEIQSLYNFFNPLYIVIGLLA